MNTKLASLVVFAVAIGLVGNAYAHKDQILGDYKVEAGWVKEPPVAGKSNSIEVIIVKASSAEKSSTHEEGHDKTTDKKTKAKHDDDHKKDTKKTTKTKSEHGDDHKKDTKKTTKNGVTGLSKALDVTITLNEEKTVLKMTEDKKTPGRYTAEYTPKGEGHPTIQLYAKIKNSEIEGTFHPEKVEAK